MHAIAGDTEKGTVLVHSLLIFLEKLRTRLT